MTEPWNNTIEGIMLLPPSYIPFEKVVNFSCTGVLFRIMFIHMN